MSSRNYNSGKPSVYAREKLGMLQRRWQDQKIAGAISRCTNVAFPGVPAEAMLGFTAFSTSPSENTTEAVAGQRFHEVGLFQVEAGLRAGPAPNPNPNAEYNSYGKLANSAVVRQMLGRPASMTANAWRARSGNSFTAEAIDDQVAVGIANLLRHRESFIRQMPSLAPQRIDSHWSLLTAWTTFSRGAGQTKNVLTPYATRLAAVPEERRWIEFRNMVAQDIANRASGIGARAGKMGAAYAIVRSEQKFMSGALFAANGGTNARWFAPTAYDGSAAQNTIEDAIARTAYSATIESTARETIEAAVNVAKIATDFGADNKMPLIIGGVVLLGLGLFASRGSLS